MAGQLCGEEHKHADSLEKSLSVTPRASFPKPLHFNPCIRISSCCLRLRILVLRTLKYWGRAFSMSLSYGVKVAVLAFYFHLFLMLRGREVIQKVTRGVLF